MRNLPAPLRTAIVVLFLAGCAPVAAPENAYDPRDLRFSGDETLAIEADFVEHFPDRDSGQANNRLAADWLAERLTRGGLECRVDSWEFTNYSRRVPLNNVVCTMPGASDREIVLTSHHDQAPTTTQGSDNDASGVAIMVHLAEILAAEGTPRYSLVFLFADAEEYGNGGTRRYLETHPDPKRIIAAVSLDNLGKRFYIGLDMDPRGQFGGYGALWLQLAAREAARAAGDVWVPVIRPVVFQVLEQAVPVAFMDEGPFVARDIPAFGFAGICSPEFSEECYETYHTPLDTMEFQSAGSLGQSGRATEALVRQLMGMEAFPEAPGPYVYFDSSSAELRGLPLGLLSLVPVLGFLGSAFLMDRRPLGAKVHRWRMALPHYLSLFLPLVASVVLLYVMVEVGLLDKFAYYFATSKDPAWTNPRWPAILIYIVALGLMIAVGRRLAGRAGLSDGALSHAAVRRLAFLAIGLASGFVFATNPFSLIFTLPLFFWLWIRGRRGVAYGLDLMFFLLGGTLIFVLIYFFGFVILHTGLYVLWYLLMMFAIRMISPAGAVAIAAILAAGLSLVVRPHSSET